MQLVLMFDYQSECHCSKTNVFFLLHALCLITSQNATAPKPHKEFFMGQISLITSQNATAPKHALDSRGEKPV